jgi:hypothetical protein
MSKNPEVQAALLRSKLMKQADKLGLPYGNDTSTEALQDAIKAMKQPEPKEEEEEAPVQVSAATSREQRIEDAKAIGAAVAEAVGKKQRADNIEDGMMEVYDIDPDDRTFPKEYFVGSSWYMMTAKQVGGQTVKLPYGLKKIVFKTYGSDVVPNGRQNNTKYTCSFTTESKAIQAWIETSREFCDPRYKMIFLEPKDAKNKTASSEEYATYHRYLMGLEPMQHRELMAMAGSIEGLNGKVSINSSVTELRKQIATALTQRDIARTSEMAIASATKGMEAILTGQTT